ncbi:SGNH/GDSL hydrolase family protein [Pseudomonas sp. SWRI100]|uniref:SGNH/GDSL hydrolase family protein n=1 Tax=Pseudomonas TaxID=286 RepID=UPI00164840C8|nr:MULTISPECIES: SGNH/GDSL hydrolase family protein [Pseudomonas]MBC3496762.1 SGNH/GDSL hydrolase family protein [Pseudomonas sp. SWRI67]MBV4526177.1 SGNH/GDSL hydrolase family protein [Pseudomonas kermanshahensis]
MTGAESLQLFQELVANGNELFLSDEDFVVINGVTKPTLKKIYTEFLASKNSYPTVADGLAATSGTGTNNRFFTVPSAGATYETRYRNDAGVAVPLGRVSSADAIEAINGLIASNTNETEFVIVTTEEADKVASLSELRLTTPAFSIASENPITFIGDEEGGSVLYADDKDFRLGPLDMRYTDLPGILVTTEENEILQDLGNPEENTSEQSVPFEGGLLFHDKIAVPEQGQMAIHVSELLVHRDRFQSVVAALDSMTTSAITEGSVLHLEGGKFGSSAAIRLRSDAAQDTRLSMPLTILNVPQQSSTPVKVLVIGDSIMNRQGGQFLKLYLQGLGFNPTMVGTLRGSASPTNNEDMTGEYGEGREGWETGDFTADITDRLQIVEPGTEAAYMAMGKVEKQRKNPFVRAATGADPADIVRNGYVFDVAFYQSRFGLETPDVVVNALGTNNVRDRTADEIGSQIYADDMLIYKQIHAAWPNARIVRSLPGTAFSSQRNALWVTHYAPMIRSMRKAISDYASSKVYMAPTWTHVSSEAGYPLATSAPDQDGFISGNFLNLIHPEGAGRHGLYEALAAYVAAAALQLN